MNILLKIANLPPSSEFIRIDAGKGYDFHWNKAHNAFCYAPASQDEVEEIYNAIAAYRAPWVVMPILLASAKAAPAAAPAAALPPDEAEARAAYVEKLEADLAAAVKTIALLRADLKAQQEKAVAAPVAEKVKGKPGRKPKAKQEPTPTDSPAPDLAPE